MTFNRIVGTDYDDILKGTIGDDSIFGWAGNDIISGNIGNDSISGGDGDDKISGDIGNDFITGGTGNDYIFSNEGNDIISAGIGNDRISDGDGDDKISGGLGRDILEGGLGKDVFQYNSIAESHFLSLDLIIDFETGTDKINISSLRQVENSYFIIQKVNHFSGKKNEMIVNYDKGENLSTLLLDHDSDSLAEFVITITGKVDPVEDIIT